MSLFMAGLILGFVCAMGVGIVFDEGHIRPHRVVAALAVGSGLGMVLADNNAASASQTVLGLVIGLAGVAFSIWCDTKKTPAA